MNQDLDFAMAIEIERSPGRVWRALTEELGEWWGSPTIDGPMGLSLEAFPGGRLMRDLGDNTGHFWGHVQVIKPPALLEIVGPMFTSLPIVHHASFRLEDRSGHTQLMYHHRAIGPVPEDLREAIAEGSEKYVLKGLKNHVEH